MQKFKLQLIFPTLLLCVLAAAAGCITGALTAGFGRVLLWIGTFRTEHLISCVPFLPIAGVCMVWIYQKYGRESSQGMSLIFDAADGTAKRIPLRLIPLLIGSTWLTHLCGGSAGREGAALQLGGSVGSMLGRVFRLAERDKQVLMLCGMSAAFSAIFRTPIAAPVFAMEVVCVGAMRYAALVPCTIASLTASWLAGKCGIPLAKYTIGEIPAFQVVPALKILLLGVCCAAVSILFCVLLHQTEHFLKKYCKNPYLRILAASGVLWVLALLVHNQDYLGIGGEVMRRAVAGQVVWYAFLAKMIFTALTLGGGFKGGEIVPSFFIGATFGCLFGHLLGISPSLCAAVGMAALFCGVTNCPLASMMIASELFGMAGAPYYLLAIAVSYLLSGYYGLYGEQTFLSSKFTGGYVSHKTRQ